MTELEKIEAWIDAESNATNPSMERLSVARKMAADIRAGQEARRGEIAISLLTKQVPVLKAQTIKRKNR